MNEPDDDKTRTFVALTSGTMVSHYRIIEKIGSGGMGEVYLAEDTELNRKVALKFLPTHLCQDADCRARFKREAQAAAKLNHPSIVTIYEVSEFNGRPFFAMEHVEGRSLKEYAVGRNLPIQDTIELCIQICHGLAAAHEAGVIHRDIKPSNILVDSHGRVRILDFGLAAVKGIEPLTKTGSTLGTLGYMAPEQVRGEPVDSASDLFSFGVVLYELIAGNSPFAGDTEAATLKNLVDREPEPLARYRTGVPDELQRIVDKALAKDRNLRYRHADDLSADLKRLSQRPALEDSTKQPSIAVLPFANLSSDPEQEYFCDGMAEEIINALSHVENLRVIARTSAFSFKGKNEDVREIGRKLGVETLLEGSVRKAGNRLRVTAQLIAAKDGSHLWSDRYDREMTDVFSIQDEISLAIVDRLKIKLLKGEKDNLVRSRAHNVEAYNLYLQGRYYWNKRTAKELKKAIEYFEKAIEKDSEFALAYAGLADCYNLLNQAGESSPAVAFTAAKQLVLKALEKDSLLGEAHASLASIMFLYDWNWPGSETEFKRAIELNPGYATAHQWYAVYLLTMNRTAEAMEEIGKAQMLDPLSLVIKLASASILFAEGEISQAEELCREILNMAPDFVFAHAELASNYARRGMYDEAMREYFEIAAALEPFSSADLEVLRKTYNESGWHAFWRKHVDLLKQYAGKRYVPAISIAEDYARLNELDRAFEWLEKAYEERDSVFTALRIHHVFGNLKADPRYAAFIKKMGLDA